MSTQFTAQPLAEDFTTQPLAEEFAVSDFAEDTHIEDDTNTGLEVTLKVEEVTVVESLADVIELPGVDAPSWYQRNSGALPKSSQGMGESQRRSHLPTPQFDDSVGFMERMRSIFGR